MPAGLEGPRLLIPVALLLAAGVLAAISMAGGYLAALPMLMIPTADAAFILFSLAFASAFLALMTLTSNDASIRKLGARRWNRLHKTGSYYLGLIFLATTLPPGAGNDWMLLACLGVLTLRIAAYQRVRRKKAPA